MGWEGSRREAWNSVVENVEGERGVDWPEDGWFNRLLRRPNQHTSLVVPMRQSSESQHLIQEHMAYW